MGQARMTIADFVSAASARKLTMLTAYDYPTARFLDEAGLDGILVGDSLGDVVLGYPNTLPVTMADMLHHVKAVARGVQKTFLIADMPFLSYQVTPEEALRNAGRFVQEAGAQAVKLEGGKPFTVTIRKIVESGIPVMAHLGLTPQSVHRFGGYRVQAREEAAARRLLEDARVVEEAGAFALVLECIPASLAELVTEILTIPTIGIGAGSGCSGQILVLHDLLGMSPERAPKFVKRYRKLGEEISQAVGEFIAEVRDGKYPGREHSFSMSDEVVSRLREEVGKA